MKTITFKIFFLRKFFSRRVECSFDNTAEKFREKTENFLLEWRNWWK